MKLKVYTKHQVDEMERIILRVIVDSELKGNHSNLKYIVDHMIDSICHLYDRLDMLHLMSSDVEESTDEAL